MEVLHKQVRLRRLQAKSQGAFGLIWVVVSLLTACSVGGAKKSYVLAEQLWTDGKYGAAVLEFEKVTAKDPSGKLGMMALYRSALTQAYYLSQYGDALRKLKRYIEIDKNPAEEWEAQKLIGEILFSRTEQYDQAISQYRTLIALRPNHPEVPSFMFNIARSQFFLRQFDEAIETYREILHKYPNSHLAERSAFEIGMTYYTRGERRNAIRHGSGDAYQETIDSFQEFLKKYPQSQWAVQAKFNIAASLEEMDQLDVAYRAYEAIKSEYPSPKVVQIRMIRIRERQTQRSH